MSDALPRNITLIGRLKKEWSRISRDIYSESYTSRQEIVPLDESTQAGVKEKPPLPGALISNGAAYRIPRIRFADPHRLRPPAGVLARGLKTLRVFFTPAPRPRFESMGCRHKRKAPVSGGFQVQLVRRIGFEPMTF